MKCMGLPPPGQDARDNRGLKRGFSGVAGLALAVLAAVLLPRVADSLSGGAQHVVDLLAASEERSRLHAVTTCVGVAVWSAGRATCPLVIRTCSQTIGSTTPSPTAYD
jgi:hypothetical protein